MRGQDSGVYDLVLLQGLRLEISVDFYNLRVAPMYRYREPNGPPPL